MTRTDKGHKYGLGSLAEPCQRCGTEYLFTFYYNEPCPGEDNREYRRKAEANCNHLYQQRVETKGGIKP
mgnify:CR=1 FL=1